MPGDTWRCLETFLVVIIWRMILSEWVGSRDGTNHVTVHKRLTPKMNHPAANVNSAEAALVWRKPRAGFLHRSLSGYKHLCAAAEVVPSLCVLMCYARREMPPRRAGVRRD